jgi:hypothetical protein
MLRKISQTLTIIGILTCAMPASATLLVGEMQFFGATTADAAQLDQASGLFDFDVQFVVGSGDFAATTALTINDVVAGAPGTGAGGEVLSTDGAIRFISDSNAKLMFSDATSLDLEVLGTFMAAGYADTRGRLLLTADSFGQLVTFSGSVMAIGAPGTLSLVTAGLLLSGACRRRH